MSNVQDLITTLKQRVKFYPDYEQMLVSVGDIKTLIKLIEELEQKFKSHIDELEKHNHDLDKHCFELHECFLNNAQELEKYKKDAERYRWFRHGDNDELCCDQYVYSNGGYKVIERFLLRNENLDEKIDKHMQIEKEYYAGFGIQHN